LLIANRKIHLYEEYLITSVVDSMQDNDHEAENKRLNDKEIEAKSSPQAGTVPISKETRPNSSNEEEFHLRLKRLENAIQTAKNCGFYMNKAHDKYIEAKDFLEKKELLNVDRSLWEADYELRMALTGKWYWVRLVHFKAKIYGLYPLISSCFCFLLFTGLLFKYPDTSIDPKLRIDLVYIEIPSTVIGVPLWSAFFGGIGSCAQIFARLRSELWWEGAMSDESYMQCIILPWMSLIFGYIAYVLMDLGVIALGGSTSDAGSSLDIMQFKTRIIVCFLAGFATDKFLTKLNEQVKNWNPL
jgi:hypothetical protein